MKKIKLSLILTILSFFLAFYGCKSSSGSRTNSDGNPIEQKLSREIDWENEWRLYVIQNWLYDIDTKITTATKSQWVKWDEKTTTKDILQEFSGDFIKEKETEKETLKKLIESAKSHFNTKASSLQITDDDLLGAAYTRDKILNLLDLGEKTHKINNTPWSSRKPNHDKILTEIKALKIKILSQKIFSGNESQEKFEKNITEKDLLLEKIKKAISDRTLEVEIDKLFTEADKKIKETPNELSKDPGGKALTDVFKKIIFDTIDNLENPKGSLNPEEKNSLVAKNRRDTQRILALKKFKRYVVFGDSLSDFGSMRDKNGVSTGATSIMVGILNGVGTGLNDSGMFSDKHNWLSYLYARLIHGAFIKIYPDETKRVDSNELKKNVEEKIIGDSTYNQVKVAGKTVIQNYAEGGASTAKGKGALSEYVLKILRDQRREFLYHENLVPKTEKIQLIKETLLFQMLGANDYVTANEKPTKEAADLAMTKAIIHYKRMRELGYKHFTYAVTPDVSLSPGLQYKTSAEQISAHNLVHYLNKAYYDFVKIIKEEGNNDHLTIKIFDFNDTFLEELSSVEDIGGRMTCLGIKENNLKDGLKDKCPNIDDNTFAKLKEKNAIKFYDASHPTSDVYIKIAQNLVEFLSEQYEEAKTN